MSNLNKDNFSLLQNFLWQFSVDIYIYIQTDPSFFQRMKKKRIMTMKEDFVYHFESGLI